MPTERTAQTYTVSLPPDLAQKAEALAQRDSRPMDELFREALNAYCTQNIHNSLLDLLVSGDKDLLILKQCKNTRILTSAEYVAST